MSALTVDPRAWNILAGLCLTSSCSDRAIGADGNETETTQGTSTTLETGGPECQTDTDCPYGYVCQDSVCEYYAVPDGHWGYVCYEDQDCGLLEWCNYGYCETVPQKPYGCPPPDPATSLEIPVVALGLSFVDVDADGASELVIATQSELQVYESGSDMPLVSPRGLESDSIDAMVGGQFDAMAGEDVVILFADELHLHGSDGVGNLAAPSVSPSPWPDSVGLLAGEFDDDASATDLLIWASSGAGVLLGGGEVLELSAEDIVLATARSVDDPLGGFVLVRGSTLDFYTVDGAAITSSPMRGGAPHALTSIAHLGDIFDLSASHKQSDLGEWTLFEQWGPGTGNLGTSWGTDIIQAILGGDFDGDGQGDLALVSEGGVRLHLRVLTDESCTGSYAFNGNVLGLAVGDHDGDGDDELAIRSDVPHVAILDGE
jgi:hypothetical protein